MFFQRSSSSEERIISVKDCDEKLRILLNNYEALKERRVSYEEFYNLYGRAKQPNFSKKHALEINIQPDIVQIYESAVPKSLKGASSKQSLIPSLR